MPQPRRVPSFRSSAEKDLVRREYQRKLVEYVYRSKARQLRYFGLPGEDALDLQGWRDMLSYVSAVEMRRERLRRLEQNLDVNFADIRYRTHYGKIDQVILANGSRDHPTSKLKLVPVTYNTTYDHYIWDFDIVYLDYYGTLLPYQVEEREGEGAVAIRSRALRHLFTTERQDGWQEWMLMITVECQLFGSQDHDQICRYLEGCQEGLQSDASDIVKFCLSMNQDETLRAARLVQATLANIIADAARANDVQVKARPALIYQGSGNTPMLFFAYHVIPNGPLSPPQHVLPLLKVPHLGIRTTLDAPWFRLLADQPPGLTPNDIAATLDFLSPSIGDALVEELKGQGG